MIIKIHGRGNFTQIGMPAIDWPAGLEVFEPSVKETLDKSQVPLRGTKIFRYGFLSSQPGIYQIQPVIFSFFDVKKNKYQIIKTRPLRLAISHKSENKRKSLTVIPGKPENKLLKWVISAGFFY